MLLNSLSDDHVADLAKCVVVSSGMLLFWKIPTCFMLFWQVLCCLTSCFTHTEFNWVRKKTELGLLNT